MRQSGQKGVWTIEKTNKEVYLLLFGTSLVNIHIFITLNVKSPNTICQISSGDTEEINQVFSTKGK